MDWSYSILRSYSTTFPYSNCAKVLMLPVSSWYDVSYVRYDNDGRIASDSEYGRGVYAKALDLGFSNTTSREENILCVLSTFTRYLFLVLWHSNEDATKTFLWLMMHI